MDTVRLIAVIAALVGVDLLGALLLKESALRRSPGLALAGVACFVLLACILYAALELSSLTLVTLGWIVVLQVSVMVVDHWWYDVTPGRVQLVAIVVAMLALAVAAVAPTKAKQPSAGGSIPMQRNGPMTIDEYLQDRPDVDGASFDAR